MKSNRREIYSHVKDVLFKGSTPTQSLIRRELEVVEGTTSYKFDFTKKNAAVVTPTEILLESGEAFVASHLSLGIAVAPVAKPGLCLALAYPNPIEITKAAANPAAPAGTDPTAENLEIFYNSFLKMQSDQDIVFERLHTSDFRVVPQTQLSAINDSNQGNNDEIFREVQPMPVIFEGKKNVFELSLPPVTGLVLASKNAGVKIRLVLQARGFLLNPTDAKNFRK